MKEKVFLEIGLGNPSFISTEIEKGKKEYRVNKLIKPKQINDFYIRIWILKRVLIFSTKDRIKYQKKNKSKFKFLIGIGEIN